MAMAVKKKQRPVRPPAETDAPNFSWMQHWTVLTGNDPFFGEKPYKIEKDS